MTHTLHREGSVESLRGDYVVLCMPAQRHNVKGSEPKLKRFFEIARNYDPVNIGDNRATGSLAAFDYDTIIEHVKDGCVIHAVYDNPQAVIGCLKQLHEEDLGISIVVSGLMDAVKECCGEAGLKPHTVNFSLGIHGKTEKLFPDGPREITTMCGHGMLTSDLVLHYVDRIKQGKLTPEKASNELCKLCICGIFNPVRSALLLKAMAEA